MDDVQLNYPKMIETAMRGVVREALSQVAEHGLPGQHHFYISFDTTHDGVDIPDHLRARFPETMTIVIQHQFWGLEVGDEAFAITLSFNRVEERLHIPFAAVTGFADPSVQFGLQIGMPPADAAAEPGAGEKPAGEQPVETPEPEADKGEENEAEGDATVVALDAFRKK